MRRELAVWGIKVSVIEPGNINTPIWQKGIEWGQDMIAKLPSQGQELYGPRLKELIGFIGSNQGKGTSAIEVAKAVEHALTAARPKTRYVVGSDAKLGAMLLKILPDRWVDRFLLERRSNR
jgi:NAD(P)-dependent dehydrogenase (short-subunit alcohol dehydrogenase family)